MLSLSPVKLLVVFVVAMILLGPDKLPQLTRQLGAAWRTFRQFHERVEQEVRQNIPDLPSTTEIARMARSPVAFLNRLAESPTTDLPAPILDPAATGSGELVDAAWPADPSAGATGALNGDGAVPPLRPATTPRASPVASPHDPSMN